MSTKLQMSPVERRTVSARIRKQTKLASIVDYEQFARLEIFEHKKPDRVYILTYPLSPGAPVCLPTIAKIDKFAPMFGTFER